MEINDEVLKYKNNNYKKYNRISGMKVENMKQSFQKVYMQINANYKNTQCVSFIFCKNIAIELTKNKCLITYNK